MFAFADIWQSRSLVVCYRHLRINMIVGVKFKAMFGLASSCRSRSLVVYGLRYSRYSLSNTGMPLLRSGVFLDYWYPHRVETVLSIGRGY